MVKRMQEDEAGITLVEVLVAIVVLGIVLTAFFEVMTGNLRSLSDSRARQEASQASTEVLERLRATTPAEIAMNIDTANADRFVPATVSCGTPTAVQGRIDPDGDEPLGCEELRLNTSGVIENVMPWFGDTNNVSVSTYATTAAGTNVPAGSIRVTVVVDYELADGPKQIRRSAFFSEVPRD